MSKQIELIFPKRKIRIPAILLEDEAPQTCEAIWSVLSEEDTEESIKHWPEKGAVHHGKFAGPELYCFIPLANRKPPTENLTYRPIPGDIMLFIVQGMTQYIGGKLPGEFFNFAVFYDRGSNLKIDAPGAEDGGWKGSRFAKIPDKYLEQLRDLGNSIWRAGSEPMIVRRMSP
jgi:hypothetical protein